MPKAIVVGLTAPFQHGKTELRPAIEAAGWGYVDINDLQNATRRPGSVRYELYREYIPGCLDEEGGETVEYYRHVTPELRSLLLPTEIAEVVEATRKLIASLTPGDKVVLSWELWPRILDRVQPDHMLVCMQPRERWFDRLHRRIDERGWGDWTPTDPEIERLIRTMNAEPAEILSSVSRLMPLAHSVIDVSPEDWGATALLAALSHLT